MFEYIITRVVIAALAISVVYTIYTELAEHVSTIL